VINCEHCSARAAAALVQLDSKSSYLCRPCTEAVQAQHSDACLCDACGKHATVKTVNKDGKPFSVCGACAALADAGSSKRSKKDSKSRSHSHSKTLAQTAPQVGFAAEQGRRSTMEDAELLVSDLHALFPEHAPAGSQFYGVYDGHGGQRAAEFVKQTLHHKIVACDAFKAGRFADAVKAGYAACDDELLKICDAEAWQDGTTAVVALLVAGQLITSCVGDSELVACVGGAAQCRSFKHKPNEPAERARIQAAGGVVLFNRLGASMAVSRAFGDKIHKHPFNGAPADHMSAEPFIDIMPLDDVEYLILACDGVWDHVTYDASVQCVSKLKTEGKSAEEAARALVQASLDGGSADNCTAIVVYLK
jgi:serine/threonine protein phosphatase PrpC